MPVRKERAKGYGNERERRSTEKGSGEETGGTAVLIGAVPVKEVFLGQTAWEGIVHIFDLYGDAKSTRAYAWSSPIAGSDKRRFYAVLHLGGIRSPMDAVRAAIVAESHEKT